MKMFDEKFRDFSISKKIVGRFQNSLLMILINRFGQNFVQNYVEFNGGGRGIKRKGNSVLRMQKSRQPMPGLQKSHYG